MHSFTFRKRKGRCAVHLKPTGVSAGTQGEDSLYEAMALDERASEGEDAELDDVEDFKSEESEVDDEATLEEEEVSRINLCCLLAKNKPFALSQQDLKSEHVTC